MVFLNRSVIARLREWTPEYGIVNTARELISKHGNGGEIVAQTLSLRPAESYILAAEVAAALRP